MVTAFGLCLLSRFLSSTIGQKVSKFKTHNPESHTTFRTFQKLSIPVINIFPLYTVTIVDVIFYLKRNFSDIRFCLCLREETIPLCPIDSASLCLRIRKDRI
jgi:hypothetical protein